MLQGGQDEGVLPFLLPLHHDEQKPGRTAYDTRHIVLTERECESAFSV